MSLVFSNTSTKAGIIQGIERTLFGSDGYGKISGSTTNLASFTADINMGLDHVLSLIMQAAGTWQFDDSNQTDFPIICTNLVSGQRDYTFTADGSNNLILDIYKVFVAGASGVYTEIMPVDVNTGGDIPTAPASGTLGLASLSTFTDGRNTTGTPTRYDKQANGIFLDPIPSYNYTNGLKVYINRETTYFTVADTTKKPGFAGIFHEYLILFPAYQYAYRNSLANAALRRDEMLKMEAAITAHYAARTKDERPRLTLTRHDNR